MLQVEVVQKVSVHATHVSTLHSEVSRKIFEIANTNLRQFFSNGALSLLFSGWPPTSMYTSIHPHQPHRYRIFSCMRIVHDAVSSFWASFKHRIHHMRVYIVVHGICVPNVQGVSQVGTAAAVFHLVFDLKIPQEYRKNSVARRP